PRSFGGLQIRLAANWLPDCIHNGKLTCQKTIQPGSRLKLGLGAAGCAFVTPLATKDKREYGHRCDQQDGEHDVPKLAQEAEPALRDGLSSALLPPPAFCECRHRGLARRRSHALACGRRVARRRGSTPRTSDWRGGGHPSCTGDHSGPCIVFRG